MKNDYKDARKWLDEAFKGDYGVNDPVNVIRHALSLADKLKGEPSEAMCIAGDKSLGINLPATHQDIVDNANAFKAMVAQAELELEKE